jgi:hypothetical protein
MAAGIPQNRLAETGAQPDGCFYIQHAAEVIGKRQLDLTIDPPPDIVVEVDLSTDSRGKFSRYATLGVPELWRYDGQRLTMYYLTGAEYTEASASLAFPPASLAHKSVAVSGRPAASLPAGAQAHPTANRYKHASSALLHPRNRSSNTSRSGASILIWAKSGCPGLSR